MKRDYHSYERYKEYRRNEQKYKDEQKVFPIAVIIGLTAIISLWEHILIALAIVCVVAVMVCVTCLYLRKHIKVTHPVVLSKSDAVIGVEVKINVTLDSQRTSFNFTFPAGVENGQKFVVKNILFKNKKGKAKKKNVHFRVQVIEE